VALAELSEHARQTRAGNTTCLAIKIPSNLSPFMVFFTEFGGRVVAVTSPKDSAQLKTLADTSGVPIVQLGQIVESSASSEVLSIEGLLTLTHEELWQSRRSAAVLSD
jgi:hypothetical protein